MEDAKLNAAAAAGHAQIVGFGYYGTLTPGTTTTVYVLVFNAATQPAGNLVTTFFSGLGGNLADDIVSGMSARDRAWPMISTGEIGPLAPGQLTSWIPLTFEVPTDLVHGASYASNWALWQLTPFGKGTYLDRACFLQSIAP